MNISCKPQGNHGTTLSCAGTMQEHVLQRLLLVFVLRLHINSRIHLPHPRKAGHVPIHRDRFSNPTKKGTLTPLDPT